MKQPRAGVRPKLLGSRKPVALQALADGTTRLGLSAELRREPPCKHALVFRLDK